MASFDHACRARLVVRAPLPSLSRVLASASRPPRTRARARACAAPRGAGHGTGHGIGAYLNVHEGPIGIGGGTVAGERIAGSARMRRVYLAGLREGMYLSDEACVGRVCLV